MRDYRDVEAYLLRYKSSFSAVESHPGTFVVQLGEGLPTAAVRVDAPLVLVRVPIVALPEPPPAALLRRLLEFNAETLVHAAYGIEGPTVVMCAALELENLDYNEIAAVLGEMELALARDVPVLREYVGK